MVDAQLTQASGTVEPQAACDMVGDLPAGGRITLGADRAYDTAAFVARMRELGVTPHVAQTITSHRGSNIDARTTRHAGYAASQVIRKRIEEANGWVKCVAGMGADLECLSKLLYSRAIWFMRSDVCFSCI